MNLEDIDKIFNENQHQFDKMPSDKLWERLEDKLDATPSMWEEKPQPKVKWLRYVAAAAVILMMAVPAMYLIDVPMDSNHTVNYSAEEKNATPSPAEGEIAARMDELEDTGKMVEGLEEGTYMDAEVSETEEDAESVETDFTEKIEVADSHIPTAKKIANQISRSFKKTNFKT